MARYLNARALQAAALAEKALHVAARPVGTIQEASQRRTEVDTLKWAAAKLDPSRWADRLNIERTEQKVVRHVVHFPRRDGPAPAIVAGQEMQSIGEGEVIGLTDRRLPSETGPDVSSGVTPALPNPQDDADG